MACLRAFSDLVSTAWSYHEVAVLCVNLYRGAPHASEPSLDLLNLSSMHAERMIAVLLRDRGCVPVSPQFGFLLITLHVDPLFCSSSLSAHSVQSQDF